MSTAMPTSSPTYDPMGAPNIAQTEMPNELLIPGVTSAPTEFPNEALVPEVQGVSIVVSFPGGRG